ncbi:MAG: hypothetical protein K2K50_06875, partial [Anaeroplasmataceae bacterium]|nr:hypothetical protein [Anaeroplasmataceae bacterium]
DEDGNSRNLNQLENKLTDLDSSKFYSISGSYSTTLNEEEATFEITPIPFTTSSFEYFEQIEQEKTEENISANSISISLSEFENNVPAGYTLAGFEVLNSSEELMEDIPYTEELEGSLYITGLENNSSYLVRPYYHYAMALMSARETTYTYKIRFVGYWYLTRGSVNYRVRMRYNATTLYTWFVDTDHHYTNERFCTFILPNELEDYYIVGCYEDLSLITKDVDAEVVLALNENPNGAYTVAFYGFKDVLKKVEEVQPGESATAPELDSSIVWQSQTYDFTSFDREYTSVSSNLSVHANYILRVVKVKPNYYWSFRVGSESVYYMVELRNSASIISVTHTLKDLTSASPDQTIDNARYTSHWYLFDNLTPNTPYKFIINIKYDINDGNGEQEIVDEVEFTTITAEATGDVTGSIEERTHCDLTINMTGLESSFIFYSLDNLKFLVNGYYNDKYSGFCLNQSAPGTAYFYHKVQDSKNSNISYMYFTGLSYEVPEFDIPVFDENKTYLDLQNGCVLYINGEFTEELHITARFHYHVEEIMSTETLQTNLIWSNYDETLGNAYIPEFDVSKWLAEMFKYEGRLDSFVEIEYTINGTLYFKPLIFSFI